jgi:hypothetical protein
MSYQNPSGPGDDAFENSGQAYDADMDELYNMGDIDSSDDSGDSGDDSGDDDSGDDSGDDE